MFNEDFKNFIVSDNNILDLQFEDTNDYNDPVTRNFRILKLPFSDELDVLYYGKKTGDVTSFSMSPFCIVNKDETFIYPVLESYISSTDNIYKILSHILVDETPREFVDRKDKYTEEHTDFHASIKNKVFENVKSFFERLDKQYTSNTIVDEDIKNFLSENTDAYEKAIANARERAIEKYADKWAPSEPTAYFVDAQKDKIYEYFRKTFEDKDAYFNETVDKFTKSNTRPNSSIIESFLIKKEYDLIVKESENNDRAKFKDAIIDIFNAPKRKTLKVIFEYPNGETNECVFSKNCFSTYSLSNIKRKIYSEDAINQIPIYAVKSIMWSRSKLLDAANFNLEYSEEDLRKDYIRLDNVSRFKAEDYKNIDFCKEIIERSFDNLSCVNKELFDNEDFIKFLFEKSDDPMKIYSDLPDPVKEDPVLFKKFFPEEKIKKIIEEEKALAFIRLIRPSIKNLDVFKYLIDLGIKPEFLFENIFDYKFYVDPKVLEIMDGKKLNFEPPYSVIGNLFDNCSLDQVEKILSKEMILKKFTYVNMSKESPLKVFDYIDVPGSQNMSRAVLWKNDSKDPSIVESFAYDQSLTFELSKIFVNSNELRKFLEQIGIDYNCSSPDNEKIIPFCSYNQSFFDLLNTENKNTFLEAELDNIQSVRIDDESAIHFSTDYVDFIYYGKNNISMKAIECPHPDEKLVRRDCSLSIDYCEMITEHLKEYVQELTSRTEEINDEDIFDIVNNHINPKVVAPDNDER